MKSFTVNGKKRYKLSEAECRELMRRGDAAIANTYPKAGSGYAVSLMTENGNIYDGVSYKSDTQTLTMHSEMTALAHAAIHGETNVVAITGPNCHICKQLIYESSLRSSIDVVVIMEEDGEIKQVPSSEQMPFAWPERPTV